MILCPHCGKESVTEEFFGEHQTGCPHCGANGPYADSIEAAVSAWKDLPRMSALIAWQFQAAGAALALQRLMNAAKNMREAQHELENLIGVDDGTRMQAACKLCDAEDALDDLLADARTAQNFVK